MLNTVLHKNVVLSAVTVSDSLDSKHLPIIFLILDHVRASNVSNQAKKFIDWEWFQSLVSELISPRSQINSGEEGDKAAYDLTDSTASAYRMSTNKLIVSNLNKVLPGLDQLLLQKQKLRKLWHETRDLAYKMVVNWVTKTIRRMTQRKEHEWWETKIGNRWVIPQAILPIVKSLMKHNGLKV
jgi:hypothetical protein